MSEATAKTPADHLTDTLSQLKEMRHYSKTNVEHLTASWILFDGELKSLGQTARIEELMNQQGVFHDALEKAIEAFDEQLKEMTSEGED